MTAPLWLPGHPLLSSDEAWALDDLGPRAAPSNPDPWRTEL